MAVNQRRSSSVSGRSRRPSLRLEVLEAREVPAIIQTGLPSWLPSGAAPIVNSEVSGLIGTQTNPAAGTVSAVAAHPTDPNILFVAGAGGGVWRTLNATDQDPVYIALTDSSPSLSVASLAINPNNPNQVIAGLGQATTLVGLSSGATTGDLVGLLYTENALAASPSFRVLGAQQFSGMTIDEVVLRNNLILVLASNSNGTTQTNGIFASRDNGLSFTQLDNTGGLPAAPVNFNEYEDLVLDPGNANRAYLVGPSGLFRTDNLFAIAPNWTTLTSPLFTIDFNLANARLAIHNSTGNNIVYLTTTAPTRLGNILSGMFWSNNLGVTWNAMDLPTIVSGAIPLTDASNASPIAITSAFHGLQTGDRVQIAGVTGNLAANGVWTVTRTGQDTFTLDQSVGTAPYTNGGTFQLITGVNALERAVTNLDIIADPVDPNLVYVAGDVQNVSFGINSAGATSFTAAILRGDRTAPRGFEAIAPSFQWTPITDTFALGTAPGGYNRQLEFDAAGNLIDADELGVYSRPTPNLDTAAWSSLNGNLGLVQFNSVSQDTVNNVLLGGTRTTGVAQQLDGTGPAGNPIWETTLNSDFGYSTVDNTSSPGSSIRYSVSFNGYTVLREEYNDQNVQIGQTRFVAYASPTDPISFKGVLSPVFPNRPGKFVLNAVDPRQMMLGLNDKLYEDNDPAGFPGDVVSKVDPAGLKGNISALTYGGRQNGLDLTRISYVGTDTGELFLRGAAGGFNQLTAPGAGPIRSIVQDPDNWRIVYILQSPLDVTNTGNDTPTQIFLSTDAGATFTELTENLISRVTDSSGNIVGGLSSRIHTLAIWDSAPRSSTGGGTVLLAGGVGGVYRYVPAIVDPSVQTGGWTEYGTALPNAVVGDLQVYGNRLVAGTLGRGAYVIPDIAPTIKVAAAVTVQGDGADDSFTMTTTGAGSVVITDGKGASLTVQRSTGATFRFLGSGGADTIFIAASGQTGGDLTFVNSKIFVDAGNNPGDRLIIRNAARPDAVTATITNTTIGGPNDNLFGGGTVLTYQGLALGTLELDLGTQDSNGNRINVQSTSAATTSLFGSGGIDTFFLNSLAGTASETGNLNGINGTVVIEGRSGSNTLVVSDASSTAGNVAAAITGSQILGFAGPTDAAVINYTNINGLTVRGSNSAALAEFFIVQSPTSAMTLDAGAGPDIVNVRSLIADATILGGADNDSIRVGSSAGVNNDGDLTGINAPLTVDGGEGANQLILSNFSNPVSNAVTVGASSLSGAASVTINYRSTNGTFTATDGSGNGLWYRGSNIADDFITVSGTPAGGQIGIDGNGGNDTFSNNLQDLGTGSDVTFRGNAGNDTFNLDSGVFGVLSNFLRVVGGGGIDRATVLGFLTEDKGIPTFTVANTVDGVLTNVGNAIFTNTLSNLDYNGRGGRNRFVYADGTGTAHGSFDNPGAGIVVQPKAPNAAEIRLSGFGPIVNITNVNGGDADGLVINGDPTGVGNSAKDTLTILGVSDTNLGRSDELRETTAPIGADNIEVSDQFVAIRNESLGQLRSVAPGLTNGRQTLSLILVKGGDEAAKGDTFSVIPSAAVNLFVDGGGPTRKRNGDQLDVNTTETRTLERVNDPALGPPQTRIVTASGASIGFTGFENTGAARSIYAVGADAGGGPRVRVFDALTKEVLFDRFVYAVNFTGGVRVATGDVTGDGVPDLVVAAGIGGGPHVQVFDGVDFTQVGNFFAYESVFSGGVFIAIGDLTGDGKAEIVTGTGDGGGPVVKAFDFTGRALTAFFAYDKTFRGGVRVAAGDVNGDGRDDFITGAGVGGGPHVRVFNSNDLSVLTQFFAYEDEYRDGIYVAAGDLDGDGIAEIVVGPGGDTRPELRIRTTRGGVAFSSLSVFDIGIIGSPDELPRTSPAVLTAIGQPSREIGGIRVATADLDLDGNRQIITSRGPGYTPRIRGYTINPLAEAGNFLAFETEFDGGVYVG